MMHRGNSNWVITNETRLNEFKTILGGNDFSTYKGNETYIALHASAAMYYNFENLSFKYANSRWGSGNGYFNSVISNGTEYSSSSNSSTIKTGGELFNLLGENATVRLLTLPEVNIAIGRSDIDKHAKITEEEDSTGLYRLASISSVPNMTVFNSYSSGSYWLASPLPNGSYYNRVVVIHQSGSMDDANWGEFGVRPAVVLKSGVKVKFVDSNSNGVPEIIVVN